MNRNSIIWILQTHYILNCCKHQIINEIQYMNMWNEIQWMWKRILSSCFLEKAQHMIFSLYNCLKWHSINCKESFQLNSVITRSIFLLKMFKFVLPNLLFSNLFNYFHVFLNICGHMYYSPFKIPLCFMLMLYVKIRFIYLQL